MRTAVEGPRVAAVVESDARVVLADEDVLRVERVDRDVLSRLGTEGAILGDATVRLSTARELVAAALGAGDLHSGRTEGDTVGAALKGSGLVQERVHDARREHRRSRGAWCPA